MARRGSRVTINRANAHRVTLAIADGLLEVARTAIESARPPDAPPIGEGLVEAGGAVAYADGKKVGDTLIDGQAIRKPRAFRVPREGVLVIGGFGFPASFQEFGTVNHGAQPFLTPALYSVAPMATEIARPMIHRALEQIP